MIIDNQNIDSGTENHPPENIAALATWFVEGVQAEIKELEKEGGNQFHELHSGILLEKKQPNSGIFRFVITDGARLPDESVGKLHTNDLTYPAEVIDQQGTFIQIKIEGLVIPTNIYRAKLVIDNTELLRRLLIKLEESVHGNSLSSFAALVFHPEKSTINTVDLSGIKMINHISSENRMIIEQACGSSITYLWGPPGTGKTYTIAHLITVLLNLGERILVLSHTNNAVDQVLYECIKKENEEKFGPLAFHEYLQTNRILRIGKSINNKIPENVRLDKILEKMAYQVHGQIIKIEDTLKSFTKIKQDKDREISEWDKLSSLKNNLSDAIKNLSYQKSDLLNTQKIYKMYLEKVDICQSKFKEAEKAWFRKKHKKQLALKALEVANAKKDETRYILSITEKRILSYQDNIKDLSNQHDIQENKCATLNQREVLMNDRSVVFNQIAQLQKKLVELNSYLSMLEQSLINDARMILCTLTKNYKGNELAGQNFDAVIIDEISMALPPLVFLAAGRAQKRVILGGDFCQLPPIIHSDQGIGNTRLGSDTFHLSGLADGFKPTGSKTMVKLTKQHRMSPEIADIARHLVYNQTGTNLEDVENIMKDRPKEWTKLLSDRSILIIDTADLHCWSGKEPGSLSRFNLYSATAAVEIAALTAKRITKPNFGDSHPIGIITPYVAQRRLLTKLISDMDLNEWILPGTVHTFQGNEADLIIFDSVLDEPYWSARLCDPKESIEVLRDLNVAVTRAKDKLIFIGSSEWLNKHANPASALGKMWHYIKEKADLVAVFDIVGNRILKDITQKDENPNGWTLIEKNIEPLDEVSFFDRFSKDILDAKKSVFALAPYFGEYRWPRIQPLFYQILNRKDSKIDVTIVTPPLEEAENKSYVEKAIQNLRDLGAVVVSSSGLHGKTIIIDEKIMYIGSMNWSSNRGRQEDIHRLHAPEYAKHCLELLQAKHIRIAATTRDGSPRICPLCGFPIHVVNQRKQHFAWDFQAMKIGCTNPNCKGYLRNVDERLPFMEKPICSIDGKTKYRRVKRGRAEFWQCPKHPTKCLKEKVIPGDPE